MGRRWEPPREQPWEPWAVGRPHTASTSQLSPGSGPLGRVPVPVTGPKTAQEARTKVTEKGSSGHGHAGDVSCICVWALVQSCCFTDSLAVKCLGKSRPQADVGQTPQGASVFRTSGQGSSSTWEPSAMAPSAEKVLRKWGRERTHQDLTVTASLEVLKRRSGARTRH